jgi:nucleoside-diphosphate-sugar epimerase
MRCLVTGAAGFVGSSLSERLLDLGHEVVGVDRLSDYYPRHYKEDNLRRLRDEAKFTLVVDDLAQCELAPLLDGVEVVWHQAAQAGVRASWGHSFETYLRDNLLSTQRLLEACCKHATVRKVVYASSSSVYGEAHELPMTEASATHPFSPYGVTKLAAEHLAELYRHNFGLATASLRYFTVYGPRQRPDMAFHKFIEATLDGGEIKVFGDGLQTRDFTFISDIVEANVRAAGPEVLGVFNIGGGSRVTLRDVLATLGEVAGPVRMNQQPREAGDVLDTWADVSAAQRAMGYAPKVGLREGLAAQTAWHRERRTRVGSSR